MSAVDAAFVAALESGRMAAMRRNDVEALAALVHEDCVYTHSPGDRDGRESYLAKCRDGTIRYLRLGCEVETAIIRGDVAIAFGVMDGEAEVGGAPRRLHNRYAAIWTREGPGAAASDWRLIGFQPTPIRA